MQYLVICTRRQSLENAYVHAEKTEARGASLQHIRPVCHGQPLCVELSAPGRVQAAEQQIRQGAQGQVGGSRTANRQGKRIRVAVMESIEINFDTSTTKVGLHFM